MSRIQGPSPQQGLLNLNFDFKAVLCFIVTKSDNRSATVWPMICNSRSCRQTPFGIDFESGWDYTIP